MQKPTINWLQLLDIETELSDKLSDRLTNDIMDDIRSRFDEAPVHLSERQTLNGHQLMALKACLDDYLAPLLVDDIVSGVLTHLRMNTGAEILNIVSMIWPDSVDVHREMTIA